MKGTLLLAVGVVAGFVIAHQVSRTERGRAFFDEVDGKARDFREAVVDGYQAREAELRSAVGGGQSATTDNRNPAL